VDFPRGKRVLAGRLGKGGEKEKMRMAAERGLLYKLIVWCPYTVEGNWRNAPLPPRPAGLCQARVHSGGLLRAFRATAPRGRRGSGDIGHAALQLGVSLVGRILPALAREYASGRISTKSFAIAIGVCGMVILVSFYEFGEWGRF